jgi:flavodoxin
MKKNKKVFEDANRVRIVMDVLKQWGKLDTQQVCEHVANKLNENITEAFKKEILKDLTYLKDKNKISVEYLASDGERIKDYIPKIHANNENVKGSWQMKKKNYTRAYRVQVVMDVLKQWGKLDTQQVCEHVGNNLGEDITEAFKKAILRDLNYQKEKNKLSVEYHARDGGEIEDYDQEIHKNVKCLWQIFGDDNNIQGGGLLDRAGCQIHVDKSLMDDVLVGHSKIDLKPERIHFIFVISGVLCCLKISKNAMPFNIIFSRTNEKIQEEERERLISVFGKRIIILKIPDHRISSYKKNAAIGHCHFSTKKTQNNKISSEKNFELNFEIKDLDSTNGTKIYKLDLEYALSVFDHWKKSQEELTLDETWKYIDSDAFKPIKLNSSQDFRIPLMMELGGSFRVLVL